MGRGVQGLLRLMWRASHELPQRREADTATATWAPPGSSAGGPDDVRTLRLRLDGLPWDTAKRGGPGPLGQVPGRASLFLWAGAASCGACWGDVGRWRHSRVLASIPGVPVGAQARQRSPSPCGASAGPGRRQEQSTRPQVRARRAEPDKPGSSPYSCTGMARASLAGKSRPPTPPYP